MPTKIETLPTDYLMSEHSLAKQRYQTMITYPPAHWVPHHEETYTLNSES